MEGTSSLISLREASLITPTCAKMNEYAVVEIFGSKAKKRGASHDVHAISARHILRQLILLLPLQEARKPLHLMCILK